VYSNLQALQALQQWAEGNGYNPQNIFCTGDVLGYCAQPLECIDLLKTWKVHCIAGNVELQVRNNEVDCGCDFTDGSRCDLFSKNWYSYIQSKMNDEAKQWLHTLPHHIQFMYASKKILLVHGSWFATSEFIFASTPWKVKQENFSATGADVIIAGHCGLPFADMAQNLLWLNAGVIGMPANDGATTVWFLTVEADETNIITYGFHQLKYDHQQASNLMLLNGLPPSYAQTLVTGIWDNCEILPEWETAQQGKPISFKTETV
jgi:predicted phosphodiesterase